MRTTTRNSLPYWSRSLPGIGRRSKGPALSNTSSRSRARTASRRSASQSPFNSGVSMSAIRTRSPDSQKLSPSCTQLSRGPEGQRTKASARAMDMPRAYHLNRKVLICSLASCAEQALPRTLHHFSSLSGKSVGSPRHLRSPSACESFAHPSVGREP